MSKISHKVWPLADLEAMVGRDGRPFHIFLDNESMTAEIYQLPAGSVDMQSPHDKDELYYVIAGRAKFTAGDITHDIGAGDNIFVAAYGAHKFHDITEDLTVLVFFSKKEPTP